MKANELMIGDWVFGTRIKANVKVVAMDSEHRFKDIIGSVRVLSDDISFGTWAKYLEPIPLTVEILKKNGWTAREANKMGVVIFTQHFEFCDKLLGIKDSIESRIDCDPYGDFHYMCNSKSFCYINSVHELQHALKLCGIDKNIGL